MTSGTVPRFGLGEAVRFSTSILWKKPQLAAFVFLLAAFQAFAQAPTVEENYNQGRVLDLQYQGFSGQPQLEDMKELAEYAIEQYSSAEIDEIVLVYNRFISVGTQRAESSTLLPATVGDLEAAVGADATEQDSAAELEYLFEPNAEAILSTLLPAFVEMLVSRSLLESAASEHAARRAAMKAATDSAETMIKTLTRSYNRARQAAITTEIAEIVGGAAALED